jgi:hypothetical protein
VAFPRTFSFLLYLVDFRLLDFLECLVDLLLPGRILITRGLQVDSRAVAKDDR